MADTEARMRQLIGTTADWAANDLLLGSGELALEVITGGGVRAKVGDGTSKFDALQYFPADVGRSVRAPLGETLTDLPPKAARGGKLLSFDLATGNPVAVAAASGSATDLALLLNGPNGASTVGSQRDGAGSVQRSTESRLRDMPVCILDKGGVADGVTDNAAAFAAAFAQSPRVYVPAGTWLLGSQVEVPSDAEIFGDGDRSIIKMAPAATYALHCDSGSADATLNLTNIRVHDLQLLATCDVDGFYQWKHLISFNGVTGVTIERVLFRGFRGDGFYLGSSDVAGQERHNFNVTVRRCRFDGINKANRNAISVIDVDGMLVENCRFENISQPNMPGAIDFEPNAYAFPVIRNVTIRKNAFRSIGGNVGVVCVTVPNTVVAVPQNFTIEDNNADTFAYAFLSFITHRSPTASSKENNLRVVGNSASNGSSGFLIFDAKRVQLAGNNFTDCTGPSSVGNTGATDQVWDFAAQDNRHTRCGSTSGKGLTLFGVTYASFTREKWIDCGTGAAGSAIGVDFNVGTSSYVSFRDCEWRAPTGRTTVALQKEAAHTFTPNTNTFVGCNVNGLTNGFQAEESDVLWTNYTPVAAGASSAGAATYNSQVGTYQRLGKRVFYRLSLDVQAGHTGTGLLQVSLPINAAPLAQLMPGGTLAVGGVTFAAGQVPVAMLNAAAVVNGVTGAQRIYASASAAMAQLVVPTVAFTLSLVGEYMAA